MVSSDLNGAYGRASCLNILTESINQSVPFCKIVVAVSPHLINQVVGFVIAMDDGSLK